MKYHRTLISALPLVVGIFLCATAQAQSKWQGSCDIAFAGTSTLHGWAGAVSTDPFVVLITDAGNKSDVQISARLQVESSKMDTQEEKRDIKMRKSLDVTTYPKITVTLPAGMTAVTTKAVIENGVPRPTVIPFTLNLMGKDQNLTGTVAKWKFADGVATFTVSFSVSLKASGIKVPAVLGVIRVGDEIKVTAAMKLMSPEAVAAATSTTSN